MNKTVVNWIDIITLESGWIFHRIGCQSFCYMKIIHRKNNYLLVIRQAQIKKFGKENLFLFSSTTNGSDYKLSIDWV
jgi:hypothetical protein